MNTVQLAESFLMYCKQCPEQRFWQALRNWSKYSFIFSSDYVEGPYKDTFYIKNELTARTFE